MLIDANLLLYAYHQRAAEHAASREFLEGALSGPQLVRFAWLSIWAFLRIATSSRVFDHPLSIAEAQAAVAAWLSQPNAGVLDPGERHWEIFETLQRNAQAAGPLVMDAAVAAIAIEHGATLYTTDRDFARFSGLDWTNPLNHPGM